MASKVIIIMVSIVLSININAQNYVNVFGAISQEEINLLKYSKDPNAEAVVIYDIGDSYFYDIDGGYDLRFTHTKRIKILENGGVKYGEVEIPFYKDGYERTEEIVSIEASSYNMVDGVMTKTSLDPSAIYEERKTENWYVKKFAFPNVKKGTIIEFKYVLESPFKFNLHSWVFQGKIPTIYSKYTARIIPIYEYVFISQGITKFDFQKSEPDAKVRHLGNRAEVDVMGQSSPLEFNDYVHTYLMKDVPAFKDETFITSINDYLMKIDFQLSKSHSMDGQTKEYMTSWPKMIENLNKYDSFGKTINKNRSFAKKILDTDIKLTTDALVNAQNIIEYVKSAYTWNGNYSQYASKESKELITQKNGNSADINLLLVAILQEAKIKAFPVIISTRDHGQINTNYPIDHRFNHVIVSVENQNEKYLADATATSVAYNRIPPQCLNGNGLVVDKTSENLWVNLNQTHRSIETNDFKIALSPDLLSANVSLTILSTDFKAFEYRDNYKNDTIKIRKMLNGNSLNHISSIESSDYDQPSLPYQIKAKGVVEIEKIDSQLIVMPFLNFPISENFLKQSKRTFPVDFIYTSTVNYFSIIQIPEGYKPIDSPINYSSETDLMSFTLNTQINGNEIKVSASYSFKKAVYKADEYVKLKDFINLIIKKINVPVTIKNI